MPPPPIFSFLPNAFLPNSQFTRNSRHFLLIYDHLGKCVGTSWLLTFKTLESPLVTATQFTLCMLCYMKNGKNGKNAHWWFPRQIGEQNKKWSLNFPVVKSRIVKQRNQWFHQWFHRSFSNRFQKQVSSLSLLLPQSQMLFSRLSVGAEFPKSAPAA